MKILRNENTFIENTSHIVLNIHSLRDWFRTGPFNQAIIGRSLSSTGTSWIQDRTSTNTFIISWHTSSTEDYPLYDFSLSVLSARWPFQYFSDILGFWLPPFIHKMWRLVFKTKLYEYLEISECVTLSWSLSPDPLELDISSFWF